MTRTWALALLLAAAAAGPVRAWSALGQEGALEPGGSLRLIPALVQAPLADPSVGLLGQGLLRGTLLGKLGDVLRLEVHAVQSVTVDSGGPARGAAASAKAAQRHRAFGLRWRQAEGEHATAALEVDRLNVRLSLPGVDLTVGRQAINFSKTLFWNPLDAFLPFDPRAFDRDYKPGVDAARVQVSLGQTTGFEVVGALGPTLALDRTVGAVSTQDRFLDSTATGAALLGRVFTTLGHVDLSLQGGKVYGGLMLGAGGSGELLGLGFRTEVTLFRADPSLPLDWLPDGRGSLHQVRVLDSGLSIVAGLERRFDSELLLALEVFHNGLAARDDLILSGARLALGQGQSLSRDLGALTASYPLTPIWTASCALLWSLSDGSALVTPGLKWAAADEVELLAGGLVGIGPRPRPDPVLPLPQSEFGTYPNLFWLEAKVYF